MKQALGWIVCVKKLGWLSIRFGLNGFIPASSLILIIFLSSCGSNYHLKMAQKHINKAKLKGAITNIDTIYIEKEVFIPEVRVDTLVKQVNFTDTIYLEKEKLKVKVKVDTVEKTVFIEGKCEADTITVTETVQVTKLMPAKRKQWWPWLLVAFVLGALTWAYLKR